MSRILIVFACLFLFAVTANAGLTDLEMVGKFGELEKAAEQKLQEQKTPTTSVLGPLCLAYSRLKRYNKLFHCLDQLEKRIQAGDYVMETDKFLVTNSDAAPMPNMLRCEALVELGDYKGAVREANIALGRVRDHMSTGMWAPKRYRMTVMGTRGLAYALGKDTVKAREQVREFEEMSLGFMGSAFYYPLRDNIVARIYMALGEYAKALDHVKSEFNPLIRAVWFINDAAWGFSGDDGVEIYVTLPKLLIRGKCLSETGDLKEAKTTFDAILRNVRVSDNGEIHWLALFERGWIAEKEGNLKEAIDFYRKAADVIERQRSTINTETNKIGFTGDKQDVYRRLIGALYADQQYPSAFEYVERAKSRALVDLLAQKQDFSVHGGNEKQVRELLELNKKEEQDAVAQDLSPVRSQTRSVSMRVKEKIREQSPELASLVTVTSLPLKELQSLIGPDEVLVEYFYGKDDLYIFTVSRDRMASAKVPGQTLVDDVRLLRSKIENPGSGDTAALLQNLYRRLIGPVEKSLDKPNIIIVPHGALHYLPFNALYDGKDFMVDRFSIRMLSSASMMKYLTAKRSGSRQDVFVLGNPDLGDPKMDLKYAEQEAVAIAGTYPNSRVLLRGRATETAFRRSGAGFNYVHFASHGQFDSDAPLKSALLLAADPESDGRLTVDKLYSMKIDADLVTLSACETGLGQIASGDDVVGLTRGFLYAGSSSIVASLWSVDDLATSYLMTRFYGALKKLNKRDALRQAQLETKKKYPQPYYWAAFEITGSAR